MLYRASTITQDKEDKVVQTADFLIKQQENAAADVTYKIARHAMLNRVRISFDAFKNQRTETGSIATNRIRQQ
jgi:hypothetical protein